MVASLVTEQVGIMRKKINISYFLTEGIRAIFAHGLMSFAAVCMIVACLLIMGSFSLLAVNVDQLLGNFEAENEFLAYVDENYSNNQARNLQVELTAIENVASIDFISREEALEAFLETQASSDLLNTLPAEALRDRYSIRVTDIAAMQGVVEAVEQVQGIATVRAAFEIAQGFVMIRNIANFVATLLVTVLIFVSLFIMSNTIKLATFYRREEIAIMKMCGATNGFVRGPFVVEGMLLGLAGALIAYLLQWGCYELVYNVIGQNEGFTIFSVVSFSEMAQSIFISFCVAGFTIGAGGSLLAIRKFLQV